MLSYKATNFLIRRATSVDAQEIYHLHIDSIRMICAADYTPEQIKAWADPKQPQDYIDAMANGEIIFVAEESDRLSGFASLFGSEVRAVYVSPAAVRKGVGAALLAAVESKAIDAGLKTLDLRSSLTAVPFYVSQGYVRGNCDVHRMSGVDIPCIRMSKQLVDRRN
jgi:putative acetyltransferase